LHGAAGCIYHLEMADADRQQAIRAHIAWCRKERESALEQIQLFTAGGVKALIQNGDGAPQDITERVVDHGREVAENMGRIISAYEKLGEL
jgi:hypothetical protein